MTAAAGGAGIPPGVTTFLTHLSVALHKCRAYPEGHPMRVEATENTLRLLNTALADRTVLRVGIARHHLVIDGQATDSSQPVLRELAERLQRRPIGALCFRAGGEAGGPKAALERLNADPRLRTSTRDFLVADSIGPHIELSPVSYGGLVLAADGTVTGPSTTPDQLWADLARFAALGAGPLGEGVPAIADAITSTSIDAEEGPRAAAALQHFGRAAVEAQGVEGMAARRALAALLEKLPRPVLVTLLDLKLEAPEGIERLRSASEWLAVPALLDLVESAAAASGQTVSHFLLRLLRKLATRGEATPEAEAASERGVREAVQALLRGWELPDPNPSAHTELLESITRHDQSQGQATGGLAAEAGRLVRMALEVEGTGPLVAGSVGQMVEAGALGELVDLLEGVDDSNAAAVATWEQLVTPDQLRRLLLEEPVDHAACARLLRRVPIESAEGLLDSLIISESEETRRLIVGRLAELCPAVVPALVERLDAATWYLRRNLLALFADLPALPEGFPATQYAEEAEPLVRREAIRLMLRSPAEREDAVYRALADVDDRVVRVGLEEGVAHGLPRGSLPRLMKLLSDASRPVELRAVGIGLLEQFPSPAVRAWLIKRSLLLRGFFRRLVLAPKSPALLAGLGVLARTFPGDSLAAPVWRRVRKSGDSELLAVGGGEEMM